MAELENQFSLNRAAFSTGRRLKTKFLSIQRMMRNKPERKYA